MNALPFPRVTPWVGRLIAANAVILLLLLTVLTAPALVDALALDPAAAWSRPWTFLSYMFVHAGLLHLAINMLLLFMFGSAVESRLGSRQFILYYLYCGVGAALFGLGLSELFEVTPFIGASGAVLGVAMAFGLFWPDAQVIVFPVPVPLRARTLIGLLIAADAILALASWGGDIAHLAHLGGALFGYLFFRIQLLSRRSAAEPAELAERVVMVQSGSAERRPRATPTPPARQRRRIEGDPVAAEVDRVLDKISANGMESLTAAERKFLDEVSRRKQRGTS